MTLAAIDALFGLAALVAALVGTWALTREV